MTIVKKMTISFALIIGIFLGVVLFVSVSFFWVRDRHDYILDFPVERSLALLEFHQQFSEMRRELRSTVFSSTWSESVTEHELILVQQNVLSLRDSLCEIGCAYIANLQADTLISNYTLNRMVTYVEDALEMIELLYDSVYQDFFMYEDYQNGSVYELFALAERVDAIIYYLRGVAVRTQQESRAVLEGRVVNSLLFSLLAFTFAFIFAVVMTILLTTQFKNRIFLLEKGAVEAKNGNFSDVVGVDSNDEIGKLSKVIVDMVKTFESMLTNINSVNSEMKDGNVLARIDEDTFEGGYKATAAAVNTLVERVHNASMIKQEQEHNEKMLLMLDTVPLIITLWDRFLHVIDCNDEATRRFKVKDKEEVLSRFYEFHPEFQQDGRQSIETLLFYGREALEQGSVDIEWMNMDSEGNCFPTKIFMHRTIYKGDTVLVVYGMDISDLKASMEREMDVVKQAEAAAENSRAKSRFLARMSHEIRTPITAVLGISEIQLHNPAMPITIEEAFAKIYNSSQLLLGLIDDILDMSKIEAGKMRIIHEKYAVASLLNDVIQLNLSRIGSRKIKFNVEIQDNMPAFFKGDELRIKQILNNLLSNAFKYTEEGSVSLIVECHRSRFDDVSSNLAFTIADTGQGMSEKDMQFIYSEYTRFREDDNRHIEGTGLGTSIVYNLVTLMDGRIQVDSALSVGTKFDVSLPQDIDGDEMLDPETKQGLEEFTLNNSSVAKKMNFVPELMPYGKVLVVDDVDTNLYVAKGLLSFYGLDVESCDNAYSAIELLNAGKIYDIIFMDHMMPGMDGVEATKNIRSLGYTHPIVALTANAIIGQAEDFLKSGFNGFVSKPIDAVHLNSVLNKFIRDKQPPEVLEAARKTSLENENQARDDVWNYFANPDKKNKQSAFAKRIEKEFAKSQKNVAAQMKNALSENDSETIHRLAHNLKGLAATIGANVLSKYASGVVELVRSESYGKDDMYMRLNELENEHTKVISAINATDKSETGPVEKIDKAELTKILNKLYELASDADAHCLGYLEDLRNVQEAAVLVKLIEDFDYENALRIFAPVRAILEV